MRRLSGTVLRCLLIAVLLLFTHLFSASASAQEVEDYVKQWEKFDFSTQPIKLNQLEELPLGSLKLLRGLVFGHHGRIFKDPQIRKYLESRKWYRPNPNFQNSILNATERSNLDTIREAEAKAHEQIEPGDLRFYRDRLFTDNDLGWHSAAEWKVLRAEVEAIYGRRFDEEPWLQTYFEERYWYQPNPKYDPTQLSEIERKNLETIIAAQKKQRNVAISPGDMEIFQNQVIKEEMLKGLSLHELRLLRNEIYARHGKRFGTGWLQSYFEAQDWYEAGASRKAIELSPVEKQNVDAIAGYENKLREELSTRVISEELLEGMFAEDARKLRNEIFARHGRIFKEKELQTYFTSFDWYKPDPQFNEKSLSETEIKNVATILAYEKTATSVQDAIEG